MQNQWTSIALLLATACGAAPAAEPLADQVAAMLAECDQPGLPGCSLGIIRNGKLIFSRGFGSANLDHEVANTPHTVFEIGSFAKSFTCACLAILLDQHKIAADDEIGKYLPEMHPFDPPIRIKHLIRCRSGVWAQWHITQLAGWKAEPMEAPYSQNDLLTLLAGQKTLPFEPGTQFRYGTGDYFLLGMIVERVSGQSLAEFAEANLFKPLGMSDTFIMQDPTRIVKHRAVGYYRDPTGLWREWTQHAAAPGGRGLYTSIEDLLRWDRNFYDNQLPSGPHLDEFLHEGTLLGNRNVVDATPTGTYRGVKRIQFTGGMPGYVAAMTQFPEQRFTVICLCNNSSLIPWEINGRVADLYLAEALGPAPPSADDDAENRLTDEPVELSIGELQDKVGAFRLRVDGRIWKIVLTDGQLQVIDHLLMPHPLVPLGRNRFRPQGGFFHETSRFIFERSSPELPWSLVSKWYKGTNLLDRVELVEPTPSRLTAYVGDYYSDELTATYRVGIIDGKLSVRVNNLGWEPLDATVTDEFVPAVRQNFDNRVFRFTRDDQQRIVGLTAALWRVSGVSLEKQR